MNDSNSLSVWWPSNQTARTVLAIGLGIAAFAPLLIGAGPVGAFVNAGSWYLMFVGVRFVVLQAAKAKNNRQQDYLSSAPVLIESWFQIVDD